MDHKSTILVVEDNLTIRNTLTDILSMNGYKVQTASNGIEGINRALKTNPDLIISDIMMPKMDGFSMLASLQQNMPATPFIFLSARSSMNDLRTGMNTGADDYLVKPFSTTELLTAVNNRIKRIDSLKGAVSEEKEQILIRYTDLKDSISYAKEIQQEILPSEERLNNGLPEYFCLHRPKDGLSGDFYWFEEQGKKRLIAMADCTGHGIPGAMTSMIGYAFLNKAVRELNLVRPNEILHSLHEQFVDYILPDKAKKFKEGMDISLCQIDEEKKVVEFSGAKRPLFIVRSDTKKPVKGATLLFKRGGHSLYEIKGDAHSVDASTSKGYKNHTINIESGDKLYLFSDGIVDQFGGAKSKKVGSKRFGSFLLHLYDKSMKEQQNILEKAIDKWQNWNHKKGIVEEQTDDILIIGIEL